MFRALLLSPLLALAASAFAQPATVVAPHDPALTLSLDGEWRFAYVAGQDAGPLESFHDPAFAVSALSSQPSALSSDWRPIRVPGHWELQGFAEPHYAQPPAGLGLYRTTFRAAAAWPAGDRVFLRFAGVLHGCDVWLNGQKLGGWASGYNPCTFDVTDTLRRDADNVLAVRVTTRVKGWEFDTNDCWGLSGIYRSVTLFTVPPTHLADLTVQTFVPSDNSAEVRLTADIANSSLTSRLTARLLDHQNTAVASADFTTSTTLSVPHPRLWTAETPNLYTLELTLRDGDRVLQTHRQRVGLRELKIVDRVLLLNGRPLKLRGVDRHDIWPDTGRALTDEQLRRDAALVLGANMNFVRTSHYPPDERFLDLCDELGLYVMDEVPFGFGDEHLNDASYGDLLLTRARATLARDKNHPSVIIWSIGNENPITPIGLAAGRLVKQLDPTRPICFPEVGSYFHDHFRELPDFVDIYAPHYPDVARVRDYATRMDRPVIFTEYAHDLGLATDRIQEIWSVIESSPRLAGGGIWHLADQAVLRTSPTPVNPDEPTLYAWPTPTTYYDTNKYDGADGLVYADRTPQTDYFEARKAYAPVRLSSAADTPLTLTVENRFTFRSLAGLRLAWTLRRDRAVLSSGELPLTAAAQTSETVTIPAHRHQTFAPEDVAYTVESRVLAPDGTTLNEHVSPLALPSLAPLATAAAPVHVANGHVTLDLLHPRLTLRIHFITGALTLTGSDGNPLALAAGPHLSRHLTMAESLRKTDLPWPASAALLSPAHVDSLNAVPTPDGGARVTLAATYARPDAPAQTLRGTTTFTLSPAGRLTIAYQFAPRDAAGDFVEAGYALQLAPALVDFRWLGDGPYAAYPGKDVLADFGLHHLHRDDLYFPGNCSHVSEALLSSPAGTGLRLTCATPANLAVEPRPAGIVLSHNALVASPGNKGIGPEHPLHAADVREFSGEFSVEFLPVDWPAALVSRHGEPTATAAPFRPFVHSYDR